MGRPHSFSGLGQLSLILSLSLCALLWRSSWRERVQVHGKSMEPGLQDGSTVWVDKTRPCWRLPQYTDLKGQKQEASRLSCQILLRQTIVAFVYPGLTPAGEYAIKRILAVGGDSYEFLPGGLIINGELLNEPYLLATTFSSLPYHPPVTADFPAEVYDLDPRIVYSLAHGIPEKGVVPDGSYLVLGDNRKDSRDSRTIGFIPTLLIHGVVL